MNIYLSYFFRKFFSSIGHLTSTIFVMIDFQRQLLEFSKFIYYENDVCYSSHFAFAIIHPFSAHLYSEINK